jgi:hypothetical protein
MDDALLMIHIPRMPECVQSLQISARTREKLGLNPNLCPAQSGGSNFHLDLDPCSWGLPGGIVRREEAGKNKRRQP